jgi:hypothetical protein
MTLRLPFCAVPTLLLVCAVAHVIVVAIIAAAGDVTVPIHSITGGGQVALERLFHGDLSGAVEGFAAMLRG